MPIEPRRPVAACASLPPSAIGGGAGTGVETGIGGEGRPPTHVEGRPWTAPRRVVPLSGLINLDKPAGMTSHDVVNAVRRMAGQRQVGHAGTLDPMATGVLLLCLGAATRVAEYAMAGRKRYRAGILLGTTTDTYDADGKIISTGLRTDMDRAEIESALASFVGPGEQVPPPYSAIKQGGQPLYRQARRGEIIKPAPRAIDINEILLLEWNAPWLVIEIACSPGTYIRSLAHDLGQRLGSGGCLATLVRLRSGRFALEEAVSLGRLEEAFRHGEEGHYLLPADEALLDWPALIVGAEDARRIVHGQEVEGPPPSGGNRLALHRAYDLDGQFLAILSFQTTTGRWRPRKVLAPQTMTMGGPGGASHLQDLTR